MLKDKKVFLFDMDGLLIDSEKMYLKVWCEVLERHGIYNGKDIIMKVVGSNAKTAQDILERETGNPYFLLERDQEKNEAIDQYLKENGMACKKGAVQLLEYLEENHIPKYLVSSTKRETVLQFLELAGIACYFPEKICGDELVHTKPDPEPYLKAIDQWNLNKEDCVILEDSLNGIIAGVKAGIDVIGIEDLRSLDDLEFDHFSTRNDLEEVLQEIKR